MDAPPVAYDVPTNVSKDKWHLLDVEELALQDHPDAMLEVLNRLYLSRLIDEATEIARRDLGPFPTLENGGSVRKQAAWMNVRDRIARDLL